MPRTGEGKERVQRIGLRIEERREERRREERGRREESPRTREYGMCVCVHEKACM
jgi:hypothetical protein